MEKLYEWLDKEYLESRNVEQIRDMYQNNTELHQIQLRNFLNKNREQLVKEILQLPTAKMYVPNISSYQFIERAERKKKFGALISFLNFLSSDEWKKYVSFITQKSLQQTVVKIKLFSHKDYTVIHDSVKQEQNITVVIDLSKDWDERYGGFIGLHKNDAFLIVPPLYNSALIFEKDKTVRTFVKYINHHTEKKKRVLIEVVFEGIPQ